MKKITIAAALTASLLQAASAVGEPAPVLRTERDVDGKPLPFGRPAYLAPSTPLGTGPYKAVMAQAEGLPDHTLYYPADMSRAGRLPVIVWSNGACINAGNRFRIFLTEIASHGFLVIAGGPIANQKYEVGPQENPRVPAPGEPPAPPPAAPANPPPPQPGDAVGRNTAPQMIAGIDWAVKENERAGSPFYHRLDTAAIGAAGQSCGGALTSTVSADPRIKASAIFSGAPRTQANSTGPGNGIDGRATLDRFHAPVMILAGDAAHDIAHASSIDAAAYLTKVPVFMAWQDSLTHIGTYGMANGGQLARLGWQWFAWQLRGDTAAARTFQGDNCTLCREAGWHVTKQRIG